MGAQHQPGAGRLDEEGVLHLAGRVVGRELSASKLSHSDSTSGPSAISQPIATKMSSTRSETSSIGCRAPSGRRGDAARVTSTVSSTRMRSSRSASSSACRAASACDPGRGPGRRACRPRPWRSGGSAPISRLARARALFSPWWASRAAFSSSRVVGRRDGRRAPRRRPASTSAGSSAATSTGSYCLLGPDMSSTLLVGSSARRTGGGARKSRGARVRPRGWVRPSGRSATCEEVCRSAGVVTRVGARRWPSVQRCDRARRPGKSLHEVAHGTSLTARGSAQPGIGPGPRP